MKPFAALLAIALAASALPATAQEPAPVLTLSEALEIAREHNPAYRQALAGVAVAAADERRAWGSLLPTLGLGFTTSLTQSRVLTGTDEFGRPVRLDEASVFTRTATGQAISLGSVTLFDGGARLREARAARASASATRAGVEAEAVRLEARIARSYYEALRTERQIKLEEGLLESARDRLAATERLLRVAVSSPVDLLGAEIEVAQREQGAERARGEARKARLALGEAMGVGREIPAALDAELPAVFDPAALDADALVRGALDTSPLLAQMDGRRAAAEHRLRAARGARWPSVSVTPYASRGVGAQGYDALFDLNPRDQSYGMNFSVSLPLFNQFRTTYSVEQARAGRLGADEDLRAGRLEIETRVRSALIDLQNAHRTLLLAERAADLSRERVGMAQERYRLGGITFTELQDVVDRTAAAEREALAARFEFVAARVELEERAGVRLGDAAPVEPR
ncbi:MAG: TolC family protein [Gemmatimonadetes bacterium]|nr:TolC family protein [Gemmatimonadota bacterium]